MQWTVHGHQTDNSMIPDLLQPQQVGDDSFLTTIGVNACRRVRHRLVHGWYCSCSSWWMQDSRWPLGK